MRFNEAGRPTTIAHRTTYQPPDFRGHTEQHVDYPTSRVTQNNKSTVRLSRTAPELGLLPLRTMSTGIYLLLALFVSPFTGAALRHWQGCCLHFSSSVALYLSPFLVLGFSVRFIPWFARHALLRSILSGGGLILWCLGVPI